MLSALRGWAFGPPKEGWVGGRFSISRPANRLGDVPGRAGKMCRFARGLLRDVQGFTAYFKHRITSGPIEAFNNQMARFIHGSCGITNLDYLFLKMRAQSHQQN
jgi:hypothetical protein